MGTGQRHPARSDPDWRAGIEARLATLEQVVGRLGIEVRTRRLVVDDEAGEERIVAEVVCDTAELRVTLGGEPVGQRSAVVAVASPLVTARGPDDDGMGPAVAVQLWAGGEPGIELGSWPDESGRWRPHVHLNGGR